MESFSQDLHETFLELNSWGILIICMSETREIHITMEHVSLGISTLEKNPEKLKYLQSENLFLFFLLFIILENISCYLTHDIYDS